MDERKSKGMNKEKLNLAQKQAVTCVSQNLSVRAGAGTGKTRVLVERFIYILENHLASPSEILAITFTEKAANEMKSRIVQRLKEVGLNEARREIENAYIGTIHAFCARLLKEHPVEAGIDPAFRVIEEEESNLLKEVALDRLMEERFQGPRVFELLSLYSEENVRGALKEIHGKICTLGLSLEDALQVKSSSDDLLLKSNLITGLRALLAFDHKRDEAKQAITFLESDFPLDWPSIETLKSLNSAFTLRSPRGKEETKKVKESFKNFISAQVEKISEPMQEVFCDLLREFDLRYAAIKRESASFDFSDLQIFAMRLLGRDTPASEAIRKRYQKQFKFIMIDEFQDTNRSQFRLIELLQIGSPSTSRPDERSAQGEGRRGLPSFNNLFLVGDVKQSIYGFRGTDPAFFLKKEKEFQKDSKASQVTLAENFRSRSELLDFINPFFEALWQGSLLPYDALLPKRTFKDSLKHPVDFIEIEQEGDETIDESRSEEARLVAARIAELVREEGYEYRDFAMLFRAGTKMYLYEQELRHLKIPYYILGGGGFYEQPEIRDLVQFLSILENPLREVPFAAVLRSPFFHVADDTLFWISERAKKVDRGNPFYNGFLELEAISEVSATELLKLRGFKSLFSELLEKKDKLKVSEMLELILDRTAYDLYILGLSQGRRHFANVKKLIELARQLEIRNVIHLGDFIRYVKGLETQAVRESEAQVEAEEGNVVRLMTIHKAKGLEFRVVILPDLARKESQETPRFSFDPEIGLGVKAFNPETWDFEKGKTYESIEERACALKMEESKRILYVAMTRAKERLILAGTVKSNQNKTTDSLIWFDWIRDLIAAKNLQVHRRAPQEAEKGRRMATWALVERKKIQERVSRAEEIPLRGVSIEGLEILKRLNPIPPRYFERIDLPVSAYVAFINDSAHQEYKNTYELGAKQTSLLARDLKNEEVFLETEESISPAEFGTIVHQIFEHLVTRGVQKEKPIETLIAFYVSPSDSQAARQALQLSKTFLKSNLYSEIKNANRRIVELPFLLRLKYGVLQGVLDLLYETQTNEWVIVDYKTSEINASQIQETGEKYRPQMELYALACHELLGKMPQKAVLYFAKPDQVYEISLNQMKVEDLRKKYEQLQSEIIQFRKELVYESL
ncbi:MAG: UvrD-helicase domain-containing protein [Candidatus Omnitrophica bacterium]|nr:UvrD-helicase domain-containing protein [Candidatus Omnitrophota bacterium]